MNKRAFLTSGNVEDFSRNFLRPLFLEIKGENLQNVSPRFRCIFRPCQRKIWNFLHEKDLESPTVLNMNASEFRITCCGNPPKTMSLEASLVRREWSRVFQKAEGWQAKQCAFLALFCSLSFSLYLSLYISISISISFSLSLSLYLSLSLSLSISFCFSLSVTKSMFLFLILFFLSLSLYISPLAPCLLKGALSKSPATFTNRCHCFSFVSNVELQDNHFLWNLECSLNIFWSSSILADDFKEIILILRSNFQGIQLAEEQHEQIVS